MTPDPATDDVSAVLDGRLPAGVYRWRPQGLGEGRDEDAGLGEASLGWQVRRLDGTHAATKTDVLVAVGETLAFPATYGRNLDAVADLLDDLVDPTVLVWRSWTALAQQDPRTFEVLLQIFAGRASDGARTPFVVLLVEDEGGPDLPSTGLPLLD